MRVVITGGPRTGKTTLARRLADELGGIELIHTDQLADLPWSEQSLVASKLLDLPGPWVIEGVTVTRSLRKWRDQHPGEPPPPDRVIYLNRAVVNRSSGQMVLGKQTRDIFDGVEPWLRLHGVIPEFL